MPFCAYCHSATSPDDKFCKFCGKPILAAAPDTASFLIGMPAPESPLLIANQFVMVRNKMALWIKFEFQDQSGMKLGETQGEVKIPLKYTVLDTAAQPLMVIDGAIEKMQPLYFIRDDQNNILATLRIKSSFMSRKWGIWQGDDASESMQFVTDSSNHKMEIRDESGAVLASANMNFALKTEKIDVSIPETSKVDHRLVIGCVLLAAGA